MTRGCLLALAFMAAVTTKSQLLTKQMSIEVSRQRLDNVLEILSNKGGFYFSYNSTIVKKDSLVSLSANNRPLKEILSQLFNATYEFRESGNYIIIRKAPIQVTLVTDGFQPDHRVYSVTGHVYDDQSGQAIYEASVYEKRMLASSMTDEKGYFRLRLRNSRSQTAVLTVSKEFYEDTSVSIPTRRDHQLTITLQPFERPGDNVVVGPMDHALRDTLPPGIRDSVHRQAIVSRDSIQTVERTGMGRFLLTAKQKVQSLNLRNFFTTKPFQLSLTPGLSTHGKLSSQVVNNFSFNVFGGYTAGTNGFELGGLFNINRKSVRYVQVAGLFNAVGGPVDGLQIGGLNNTVLDTVSGLQIAGINNYVKGKFRGLQIGGVYNHVTDSLRGLQVAGVGNFARRQVNGVQVAGVVNISNKETNGVQVSGVINYSRRLKGVQIGLINIADTSDGYSIGLINIILKGYHKLSFSTNETLDMNVAFKTGNRRLYSILLGGMHRGNADKVYSFGYGLGSELMINTKKTLSLNPELSSQYLYLGSWYYTNILNRAQINLNLHLGKFVSLFAGPVYSVYVTNQKTRIDGYRAPTPPGGYHANKFNSKVTGWLGWNVGISFF